MENENNNPGQNPETHEEHLEETGNMKNWIQDNLRIIISVIIVVVIATGVYSYSKRSATPEGENRLGMTTLNSEESTSSDETVEVGDSSTTEDASDISSTEEKAPATTQKEAPKQPQTSSASSSAVSQETANSFVESAGRGDGLTHLARRALANYLEKNSDSTLTPEHKIYIEDYLRKNVGFNKGVRVGTSVEFSKGMIQNAIEKSKTLNERQLQNLHKYAVRVPSLS